MSGGFKRSSCSGSIGVFVVAAPAIAIATTMGQGENPTTMAEPDLWAAPAIAPIDADPVRARDEVWDAGRRSIHLGTLITLLIFLTVPSVYLLETFVPLLIGVPLIAIAAIYGSIRAIGPGGELDKGYERTDRAMKPLGLQVTERPSGGFERGDGRDWLCDLWLAERLTAA